MKYFVLIISIIIFSGCNSSKLTETPDSKFTGTWRLVDRGMFENIEIEISKEKNGNFIGVVKKINDDKYVKMFMEVGDNLVTGIKRNSNFEFEISEQKIAAPLFSAYGQGTSTEFVATFENKNTILLGNNGTQGKYIRIK
jgi:S-adenosylmethionine hydrolase